jgi:thiol-disulfide isomerase/thioredoxin
MHSTPPGSTREKWRRFRQNFWASLAFDAALLVLVLVGVHAWQTRDLPIDEPAPFTRAPLLDGSGLVDAVQAGETGIVYFFAPWCGICRHSIDNLDSLVADGHVAWASAVALDFANPAEVQEFVDDTGISLPVLLGSSETAADWSIQAFPTYYVIDSEGAIHSRTVGYSTLLGMRIRAKLAP